MIELDGEQYLNAKEAAFVIGVSRPTFYHNTKDRVAWYELPGRIRRYCRKSDIEKLCGIVAIQPSANEMNELGEEYGHTYHSA